jgi:hypothetical protein
MAEHGEEFGNVHTDIRNDAGTGRYSTWNAV